MTNHWQRVQDGPPDADITVLVALRKGSEPVWLGYFDGECWRAAEGGRLSGVTHWRDIIEGPVKRRGPKTALPVTLPLCALEIAVIGDMVHGIKAGSRISALNHAVTMSVLKRLIDAFQEAA